MLKNILLVAFRNLYRNKGYSLINILGLSIGIACAVLVMIYVSFELSFDKCFSDYDRIYRIRSDRYFGETIDQSALSSSMVAPTLLQDYPQVEYATRFFDERPAPIYYEGTGLYLNNIARADLDFFEIFDIPFIYGFREEALNRPSTAVITQSTSEKFFGDENPVGKILRRDTLKFEITGVIEDWPENCHFEFDLITSWEPYEVWDFVAENPWNGISLTYVKLMPDTDIGEFEKDVENLWYTYVEPESENPTRILLHYLQPLRNIHLNMSFRNDVAITTNPDYLVIFSIIGFIVLVIACINYMNLTTAQYMKRSREIAIRKTVGAHRSLLICQFLTESLIFTFIAHIIAVFLVEVSIHYLNNFLDLNLSINHEGSWFIGGLLILILFTGLFSGSYPAFFLSSFQPIAVIRGVLHTGKMNVLIRRTLVIIQFTVSISLVIAVLTIYSQLHFMKNHALGFDRDDKIVLRFPRNHVIPENYHGIKQEFLSIPSVNLAAFSSTVPGQWNYVWRTYLPEWEESKNILMNWYAVDEDFVEVMGLELISGIEHTTDMNWNKLIVNEEAVKAFGWGKPDDAINKSIWRESSKVIGVVKNFHLKGLHHELQPMGMFRIDEDFKYLIIDIQQHNLNNTIESLQKVFNKIIPDAPFYYFFLDEDFNKQYKTEEQLSKLFSGLTILGLVIACLGLLGLASFMVQQRTKEIGIRKVNGASVSSIIIRLVRAFTRWILVANLIAWPLSWFFLQRWLEEFAFHIDQNIWIYIIAGGAVFILAIITVIYQAWKAAVANPVDAIKYE